MKSANIVFGFGIGLYFSVGVGSVFIWCMFYYSIIIGYMLCLIFKDKMNKVDKVFGATICTLIWAIYLLKATFYIEYPNVINWTRFYIGIIFVALTMIYMIYCIQDKIRYHA